MYQHLEYFPYGETWVEDGGSGQAPGYKFTGKELDPETGLYYYGARYYDPVLSKWISADPAIEKYLPLGGLDEGGRLPGFGGVFHPVNLAAYTYTHSNPVKLTDPDGETPALLVIAAGIAVGVLYPSELEVPKTAVQEGLEVTGAVAATTTSTAAVGAATKGYTGVKAIWQALKQLGKEIIDALSPVPTDVGDIKKAVKKGEPPQLARGKKAHMEEPIRPGEIAEVRTPSGKRMDRYDPEKRHIREIKSDSPREVRRGQRQVEQYKQEMERTTGKPHTTEVTTYDPKKYE